MPIPVLPVPGTSQGGTQPSQDEMQAVIMDALNRRAQGQQNMPSSTVPGVPVGVPNLQGMLAQKSAAPSATTDQPLPPGMPATQNAPVAQSGKSAGPQFDDETRTAAKVLISKLIKTL